MPAARTRKHKSSASVPSVGDPDRKRVLNVLAQRRYRQRRREKMAALEVLAQNVVASESIERRSDKSFEFESEPLVESCSVPSLDELDAVEEVARMPSDDLSTFFGLDSHPFDLDLLQNLEEFSSLPTPIPSPPSPYSTSPPTFSFPLSPDGAALGLPILSAMNAFTRIATALGIVTNIWDPSYLHVLPQAIPGLGSLPKNLHPVPAQYTIPHHPALDILPWPTVREKLICILSLPSPFRPPVAQQDPAEQEPPSFPIAGTPYQSFSSGGLETKQSSAIIRLSQDLDDLEDGGGVRVHGNMTAWNEGNELMEEAWEVGSLFYSKWWWCLDQRIIDSSNKRRKERGLGRLKLTS